MARFYLNGQPCNFPLSPLDATCTQVGSLQRMSALTACTCLGEGGLHALQHPAQSQKQ